jgi:hypothetical protein
VGKQLAEQIIEAHDEGRIATLLANAYGQIRHGAATISEKRDDRVTAVDLALARYQYDAEFHGNTRNFLILYGLLPPDPVEIPLFLDGKGA